MSYKEVVRTAAIQACSIYYEQGHDKANDAVLRSAKRISEGCNRPDLFQVEDDIHAQIEECI